jgi:iron-sulfur cluster assembly accessory protein
MTREDDTMVTVTARAAERVRHSADLNDARGLALRIQVRRRPDGGLAYQMGFDAPAANDQTSVSEGVTVVVDPQSVPFAEQLVLDYEERPELPDGGEFVFMNPLDVPGDTNPA